MNDLENYFYNISEKQIFKWTHYFDIYEKHFSRFRDKPIKILEIGVWDGGSLKMWKNYFHPESLIVGLDIDQKTLQHQEDNIDICIMDQSNTEQLTELINKYNCFDIIIDDGSHINEHQRISFEFLFPYLSNNGVYLVEDVHTSYWKDCFNGGLENSNSFIEHSKLLIDKINAYHIREKNCVDYHTNNINSISFYDSIVVFEKIKRTTTPYDLFSHNGHQVPGQRHPQPINEVYN